MSDDKDLSLVRAEAVRELDESVALAKAHFLGGDDVRESNRENVDDHRGLDIFRKSQAVEPPFPPDVLVKLFEHSNALRQNVDAYAVNIDGHGHRFEPVIDPKSDDAFETVRDAIFFEKLAEKQTGLEEDDDLDLGELAADIEVTDAEVEKRLKSIEREMSLEKSIIESHFNFATVEESFVSLRRRTRTDIEIQGGGAWEVIRDDRGRPVQYNYLPAFTIRLMKASEPIEVELRVKRTPITFEVITVRRRFRRFVQAFQNSAVWFKEYGDPRVISSKTGKVYDSEEAMRSADGEEDAKPATELLYFRIHSPRTPYGVPRWIGNLLSILGSRQAEEVNFLYFDNKSVPPLVITVSGGRLSQQSHKKLEDYIKTRIKGRKNFHQVLILEADEMQPGTLDKNATGRMQIKVEPLTMAIHNDALFQNYDERNIDKVGMGFRLPRMLRGDIRDFNRATADAALGFAESQVFAPERHDFDWIINRQILPALKIKYWRFVSNSPVSIDPVDLAEIVESFVMASILTPEEGRELAESIFNRNFTKLDELWTKIPPDLLKSGILPDGEEDPMLVPEEDEDEPAPEPGDTDDDPDNDDPDAGGDDPDEKPVPKKRKAKKSAVRRAFITRAHARLLRKSVGQLAALREELRAEELAEHRHNFNKAKVREAEIEKLPVVTEKLPAGFFDDTEGNGDE